MNPYANTSNRAGLGFPRTQTIRRLYRQAAERRQAAHQALCDLHAKGRDLALARKEADKAEALFWHLDHHFRRYRAFYRAIA